MMADIEADMKKRRIINSITQGGAISSKTAHYLKQEYLDVIGDDLSDKYRDINQASLDMIDFVVSQGKQNAQQMGGNKEASVGAESVFYDFEKEKWIIKARAINFAVLVHEIVKGMYEIIGLFGFNDLERGEKVVGQVDKMKNEPEDLAYGQMISKNLFDIINKLESNVTPEERDDFLQDIYKLPNEEFIKLTELLEKISNEICEGVLRFIDQKKEFYKEYLKGYDLIYIKNYTRAYLLHNFNDIFNQACLDVLDQNNIKDEQQIKTIISLYYDYTKSYTKTLLMN
jgi:hypothetical protein